MPSPQQSSTASTTAGPPTKFRERNTTRSPNFRETTAPPEKKEGQISSNATGHRHDTALATCPKFHLEEGDYSVGAGGRTATIPAYNVTLNATEFEVVGGRLVICVAGVARVSEAAAGGESKFSDAMGYV